MLGTLLGPGDTKTCEPGIYAQISDSNAGYTCEPASSTWGTEQESAYWKKALQTSFILPLHKAELVGPLLCPHNL